MKWLEKVAKVGYIDTQLEPAQIIENTSIEDSSHFLIQMARENGYDEAKITQVEVSKKQFTFSEILRWSDAN